MKRVVVLGSSGSGKTTVARRMARTLDFPMLELDSVYHLQDWTPRPRDEFQRIVAEFAAGDAWVVDGSYTSLGTTEILWPRADTIVWLDVPKRTVMRRVVARTVRRAISREELWNGNREPVTNLYHWDPERNIIRWAWTRHASTRQKLEDAEASGIWAHAEVHRLRDPDDVEQWLGRLERRTEHYPPRP